jgi:hypothetical protein
MRLIRLIWYQRKDGFWNAACACGATICGISFEDRAKAEGVHATRAAGTRMRNPIPSCGPKLPDPDPNVTDPLVFP